MTAEPLYDIYILGLGIRGTVQITPETEAALHACRKVYYHGAQPGIAEYLRGFNLELEDLSPLYGPGTPRRVTYEGMADAVLNAAQDQPPVGLADYGHPMVCVRASQLIRQQAPALGLRVKVLPGISALDCLIVDLNFDPGKRGLVQYEATYALLYQPRLDPAVPCLLWQVGTLETTLYDPGISLPGRFRRLSEYLARFHPSDHRVALAVSPSDPLDGPIITRLSIDELREAHQEVMSGATLFIPPSSEPEVRDRDLQSRLSDPAHLSAISRPRTDVDAFKQFLKRVGSRNTDET